MREKKFNKGNWECDADGLGTWISSTEEPAPIAKMCNNLHFDQKANAHLIAAAPELLEAVEHLIVCTRIKWGNLDDGVNGVMDKAEQAIAKAYGETP